MDKVEKIINDLVYVLVEKLQPERVLLFGSRVKGENKPSVNEIFERIKKFYTAKLFETVRKIESEI